MLLYIHVPFCRSRCRYCSFYSQVLPGGENGIEILRGYLNGLLAEISLWHERIGNAKIDTIFFGGGTPSILPIQSIGLILNKIHKHFNVAKGAEISLEGNPDSLLEFGYMAELVKFGVNRLSMGIQSLNDANLKMLGRPHTVKDAVTAYETARISGFNNISLDLIWGLPAQRLRLWLEELKTVTSLKPEHLSCYNLTLDEDCPMSRAMEKGQIILPEEKEQSSMYAYGSEFLETKGFLQYEVSNFARMGYKCRHNLGYWEGRDYLGLGPSASSTIKDRRWTNPPDIVAWLKEVANKSTALDYELLDSTTRVLELIMLRLRTDRGLRLQAYKQLTGRDFVEDNKQLIHGLHRKGMIRMRNGYLSLTSSGMLVSNSILEYLFSATREKLEALPAAESKALADKKINLD